MRYLVAALIGAALATVAGYAVSTTGVSFGYWLENPLRHGGALWAAFGAAVGIGLYWLISEPPATA
jgi:hypothetical protein